MDEDIKNFVKTSWHSKGWQKTCRDPHRYIGLNHPSRLQRPHRWCLVPRFGGCSSTRSPRHVLTRQWNAVDFARVPFCSSPFQTYSSKRYWSCDGRRRMPASYNNFYWRAEHTNGSRSTKCCRYARLILLDVNTDSDTFGYPFLLQRHLLSTQLWSLKKLRAQVHIGGALSPISTSNETESTDIHEWVEHPWTSSYAPWLSSTWISIKDGQC